MAKSSFRFAAIGRRAWADLVAEHAPTRDDIKADPRSEVNPRTFPTAAVAASCVDPGMTLDDATRLEAALNDAQWTVLWDACLAANLGGVADPKSLIAGSVLRASEQFAITAANGESPAISSSAA